MSERVIGNRGAVWRGRVTEHGSVIPPDGRELDWFVAADDRWYTPRTEVSTRQKWYSGYPVAETRIRIPGGDFIQRVYSVADLGGMTVMEFENDSPMPVVVAVTRNDLFTTREPSSQVPLGIDLPEGSLVVPVGHKSTTRVALAHVSPHSGRLPDDTPSYQQVVRGWETSCDVAGRITVPDHTIVAGVARMRSDILLGVGDNQSAVELVRMGETHADSILDVVDVVQLRLKAEKRAKVLQWDTKHVLLTAASACVTLGDETAARDIGSAWLRLADRPVQELPNEIPIGLAGIAWIEELIASGSPSGGECGILAHGIPEPWWGASFDVRNLPADPFRTVSFAVRWHGARPALLWEVHGAPGIVLSHRDWHTTDASGEALLEAPVHTHEPL
ncbi:MAG: hypothetical protein ACO3JF_07790 [Ilumatobacteraceae bacterium]